MNITKQVIDDVNIVLAVEIEKADWAESVEKQLKQLRQRVNMPGFRKGMVPMGMIKKMYGSGVTADEVNRLINDNMYKYIQENKLNVLGEPMINGEQKPVDFDKEEKFTVKFDIAIAPEFDLKTDKSVKVTNYVIKVDDAMVKSEVARLQNQYGKEVDADQVEENDVLKGDICELNADGSLKEDGLRADNTTIYPRYIKGEDEKKKFAGAKKLTSVDFNPAKAWESDSEFASVLQRKKEEVEGCTADFRFTINEIKRHQDAEMGEELYKAAFGEDCTTEDLFKDRIREGISASLRNETEYKLNRDIQKTLKEQVGKLTFPEARLKAWLLKRDEKRDAAKLDEEFPRMLEDLTWQLIEEKIVKDQKIEVSEDDIKQEARYAIMGQIMQYGMGQLPDEMIDNWASQALKDEKQRPQLRDQAVSRKIFAFLRGALTIKDKEVSMEEFGKLMQEDNK